MKLLIVESSTLALKLQSEVQQMSKSMSEAAIELHRVADLLRMVGDTAKLIAKRCPEGDKLYISDVAAEISDLADKIECLRGVSPRGLPIYLPPKWVMTRSFLYRTKVAFSLLAAVAGGLGMYDIGEMQAAIWRTEETLELHREDILAQKDPHLRKIAERSLSTLENLLVLQNGMLDVMLRCWGVGGHCSVQKASATCVNSDHANANRVSIAMTHLGLVERHKI